MDLESAKGNFITLVNFATVTGMRFGKKENHRTPLFKKSGPDTEFGDKRGYLVKNEVYDRPPASTDFTRTWARVRVNNVWVSAN